MVQDRSTTVIVLRLKVGTVCCNYPCWSQLGAEPHCRVTGTKWNVSGKRPKNCPLRKETTTKGSES